jgi:hypothetical protein
MPGMYDQGLPSAQMPPMGGAMQQNAMQPGNVNAGRDRITQALMDVQNPPPITPMNPQGMHGAVDMAHQQSMGMPAASGAPTTTGMPSAAGSMLGPMAGGGMPGQAPLVGQGGAMPGLQQTPGLSGMTQPGAPSPLQRPQTPVGGPTY